MSIKNSNDTIRNRTHDLPACSAVSQLKAPPRAPYLFQNLIKKRQKMAGRIEYFWGSPNKSTHLTLLNLMSNVTIRIFANLNQYI